MPGGVTVVEEVDEAGVVALEPNLCQATKVIRRMGDLGLWDGLRSSMHVRRRAGSYEAVDIVLFWVAFFASGEGKSLKKFAKKTEGVLGQGLAALVGRLRWMVQSGVSRALSSVCDESLEEFVEVIRGMWPRAVALQKLAAFGYRDAFDRSWDVAHYDGSVVPVRRRQLPTGDDLPAPRRRSDSIAAKGYGGRKRAVALRQGTGNLAG